MRLVTYDREGARRLGAWVGGAVVDLPDAVGHPAFPSTLEALVARNGGTTLDVAAGALARSAIVQECIVPGAHLLAPFLPRRSRYPILGPDAEVPWPTGQAYLDHSPELACVVGRDGRSLSPRRAIRTILGYVLMVRWLTATGRRSTIALSFGPWLVTPDEFDARRATLRSSIDGEPCAESPLRSATAIFSGLVVERSMTEKGVLPGVVFASPLDRATPGVGIPLEPLSVVEVQAEGLGLLRADLGLRPEGADPERKGVPREPTTTTP